MKSTTTTNEARAAAGRLAAAVPALERVEAIDLRLAAIEGERRALRGPLPKAEVTARLLDWLRSIEAGFEATDRAAYDFTPDVGDLVAALSQDPPRPPKVADDRHAFRLLVWLLAPALEESVPVAVGRLNYSEGPPLEDRRRRGAALAAERAALVSERRDLVETARAAGVELRHLDETARAIAAEEERESREADAARRQADAARSIDARHASERAARSSLA